MSRSTLLGLALTAMLAPPATAQLQVVGTTPAANAVAPTSAVVSVEFDRPLNTSTIGVQTFRVFGQRSGGVQGTYSFSNGNQTVTLTPDHPFAAGEFVYITLSHDIAGADSSMLRAAGYATQFMTAVAPSSGDFAEIDTFSNSTGPQTRLYGAAAADLNGDGFIDLATINEVSSDVRVFLSLGDGSGLFGPMLPPQTIGLESSPNETADFDNDGNVDVCVGAADSGTVSILLGAGDGTFSIQQIAVGTEPHGVATLDVDGDGDIDIVNANAVSNDLSLLLNDGTGSFGSPTFLDSGVDGEWGLAAADMNGDGIKDLVVGGSADGKVRTLLGNGNGTFTPAGPAEPAGGPVWAVVLGDLDGDGDLDAATANDGANTVGILFNQGNGAFGSVTTLSVGAHTPSVDLGDLDGDGDLDVIASSFGGGFWRRFANDGSGTFTFVEDFPAPSNPSCSILFDADNDGDLDMALTDELAELIPADNIILMQNSGGPGGADDCSPTPAACREPLVAGGSKLQAKHVAPGGGDKLSWKWTKGAETAKSEFGNPLLTDGYTLCLYEDGALVQGFSLPAGQICAGKPCWRETGKGFAYSNRELNPDGIQVLKLKEGLDTQAKITLKGRGGHLDLPDVGQLTGVLDLQLQKKTGGVCWGARFTPPFKKNDGTTLQAVSDPPAAVTTTTTTTTSTTTTTLAPVWSAIHANVIGPTCGGCHGGNGNLSGLDDCNLGHANLVNTASFRLSTMDRVEPTDPTNSFLMHKLDGTQGTFDAQCLGASCGSSMPLGGPLLSVGVRDAIRTWITNGALNDCP